VSTADTLTLVIAVIGLLNSLVTLVTAIVVLFAASAFKRNL